MYDSSNIILHIQTYFVEGTLPISVSGVEMSTGTRSFKAVFTAARRLCDVTSDVTADVTRRVMTATMASAYLTVSSRDCIADHVTSARHFSCDVMLNVMLNRSSSVDVTTSNDVTAASRCHSNVL